MKINYFQIVYLERPEYELLHRIHFRSEKWNYLELIVEAFLPTFGGFILRNCRLFRLQPEKIWWTSRRRIRVGWVVHSSLPPHTKLYFCDVFSIPRPFPPLGFQLESSLTISFGCLEERFSRISTRPHDRSNGTC